MNSYTVVKQQELDDELQVVIARTDNFEMAVEIVTRERLKKRNADWHLFIQIGPNDKMPCRECQDVRAFHH